MKKDTDTRRECDDIFLSDSEGRKLQFFLLEESYIQNAKHNLKELALVEIPNNRLWSTFVTPNV
jgi:hypothetical protein